MSTRNIAKIYSAELVGIEAQLIEVEVDINVGLHSFNIVGLADRALNEARERVNSALKNSGAKPPNRENRKITVNLAPADIKKTGSHYDLSIAIGYLSATKQIKPFEAADKIFVGELALDGRLRPVAGALNIAEMAARSGFSEFFLPKGNAAEAMAAGNITIVPVETLAETIAILEGRGTPRRTAVSKEDDPSDCAAFREETGSPDLSEIIGQENAKRALIIAAAGGHNILMIGPPGVGKSMLARSLIGILPNLTRREAIEVTKIWSAAGSSPGKLMVRRPFRAPHQTASVTALVGGGSEPRPGEASLAHRGVLFLDELPEFAANALEALREPMESRRIRIARARRTSLFPAQFSLVAAMNPCPCGYYGDPERACTCTAYEVMKYQRKISGPLLDRIDIQIKVGRVKIAELRKNKHDGAENRRADDGCGEANGSAGPGSSASAKEAVFAARVRQGARFETFRRNGQNAFTNADMTSREAQAAARLEPDAEKFLESLDGSKMSPRGYYRVLKVARTIADLDGAECVSAEHLAEAFSYRLRDEPG